MHFILLHPTFVTTAPPPPTGMNGGSGANVRGSDLLSCYVSGRLVMLHKYTPMEFTIRKSRAMTICRSSQCRAFSRALMDEKSSSWLFPVGGGCSGYK